MWTTIHDHSNLCSLPHERIINGKLLTDVRSFQKRTPCSSVSTSSPSPKITSRAYVNTRGSNLFANFIRAGLFIYAQSIQLNVRHVVFASETSILVGFEPDSGSLQKALPEAICILSKMVHPRRTYGKATHGGFSSRLDSESRHLISVAGSRNGNIPRT